MIYCRKFKASSVRALIAKYEKFSSMEFFLKTENKIWGRLMC